MAGRHLPADHSKGDANTIGGYRLVHDRPAAFEGSDGMSYSVELLAEETGEPGRAWGACLLFLRWKRIGEQGIEGHLETDWLAHGDTADDALERLSAWPLSAAREQLEALLAERRQVEGGRRWWDVMKEEG